MIASVFYTCLQKLIDDLSTSAQEKIVKKNLFLLWLGFALSSLFFYPLLASLNQEIYYFHWDLIDTWEMLASWLLVGILSSCFLFFIEKVKSINLKLIATSFLIFLPFSFYFLQISRMAGFQNELVVFSGIIIKFKLLSLIILVTTIVLVYIKKELILAIEKKIILIFSFLNIFFIAGFINLFLESGQEGFNNSLDPNVVTISDFGKESIFFIVFDELSYQYLYESEEVKADYKSIKNFSDDAKNFHLAYAPGVATLQSMPSYVAGKQLDGVQISQGEIRSVNKNGELIGNPFLDENIFTLAKSFGFQTALMGWYHNYCAYLYEELDFCRAFSLYKFVSKKDGFSLANSFGTNLILLPYQKPFGYLKIQSSMRSHANTVANILASSKYAMEKFDRSFQFLHFPIPHSPFIFDGSQYVFKSDAYIQTDKNYYEQLVLVDNVFGEFVAGLKRLGIYNSSTIILTSDHNYRIMFDDDEDARVPLLIKSKGINERIDEFDQVSVENELLKILNQFQ